MKSSSFPYSYWLKALGVLIFILKMISLFLQYREKGAIDPNQLALGICWGLFFIFFSKEKVDDEMTHALKFRALATAVIISFFSTLFYNYYFLNWQYNQRRDLVLSISAYQFLALTLIIATTIYYYRRHQSSNSKTE